MSEIFQHDQGEPINPETEIFRNIRVAVSEQGGNNPLEKGTIEIADFLEYKNSIDKKDQKQTKGCLVHLPVRYMTAKNEKVELDIANENFSQTVQKLGLPEKVNDLDPEWVSIHFGWGASEEDLKAGPEQIKKYIKPEISAEDRERLFRTVCSNISKAKQLFEGRDLLVENLDFVPGPKHEGAAAIMADPEFISKVLQETDVGLVLDLQHAYVSAHNLGMGYFEYLSKLPLERVGEIHCSRPTVYKKSERLKKVEGHIPSEKDNEADFWVDTHEPFINPESKLPSRVMAILNRFFERMTKLKAVTIELDKPNDIVQKNIAGAREILRKIQQD